MKTFITLGFLVILCLHKTENAKILAILPLPTVSHFVMFSRLLEELASRGHEVDVITPLKKAQEVPGLNVIPIQIPDVYEKFQYFKLETLRGFSVHSFVNVIFADRLNLCEICFAPDAMKRIRDGGPKYDLIILEIFVTDCLFGFAHVLQAPVISVTTSIDLPWGSSRMGNPDNPSYIANYFANLVPPMTLLERLHNMITLVQTKLIHLWYLQEQEKDAKKFFGEDLPPLTELIANSSLFLVNSHFSSNQARPTVKNVIEIAGVHIKEAKPLEKMYSDFIGNSSFIYFSLGSWASSETISLPKLQSIFDVLKELKYKVIWKADKKKLSKELIIPKNILITKWVPQLDILCHPNILFFITHNGLMSTQEAIHCGVPMISIPAFSDQFINAKTMVQKGVALEFEIETATKQDIYHIIQEMTENRKYKENAIKLSQEFKDRPQKPLDEAIYWVEYVLRHKGAPQLKSDAIYLAWYQYHLLDVLVLMLSITVIFFSIVYMIICRCIHLLSGKTHKQKLS